MRVIAVLLFAVTFAALHGCGGDETLPADPGDAGSPSVVGKTEGSSSPPANGGDGGTSSSEPPVTCEPFEKGQPITAPDKTWTWVDFDDSLCMNNTKSGIGVNLNSASKDVVIYMQGGNACFNAASCQITANQDGYDAKTFANEVPPAEESVGGKIGNLYLLNRDKPNNIFKDWNYVYIPYCSGDVYAGDKSDVSVGLGKRQFHGYKNIAAFLKRLAPTFPNAGKIFLTGQSAGGFGAAYNYDQFSRAFCPKPIILVDDSGPPMAEEFVPPCLQKHFIETWGVDKTLPKDCAECAKGVQGNGVFIEPFLKYVRQKYMGRELGMISSVHDETIRKFWGFGNRNCLFTEVPQSYPAEKYQAGLEDIRDRYGGPDARLRMFLTPGTFHGMVHADPTTFSNAGVTLQDWLQQVVNDDPAWKNVP
ncbi:MAG TPA: pectin acetylesterase-family hydrolase [Labilithrix sp.]|nr:pectin acetylesterase-family hydrolase [Labilithrix sp.]